jgi:tetratricopeptide (TPR) repeat protein
MHGGGFGGGGSHGGSHSGHGSYGRHDGAATGSSAAAFALIDIVRSARKLQDSNREAEANSRIDAMMEGNPSTTEMSRLIDQSREAGDRALEAAAWIGLAQARVRAGYEGGAIEAYTAALVLCREVGDRALELAALTGFGGIPSLGIPEAAKASILAAALWHEAGDRTQEAEALTRLGDAGARGAEVDAGAGLRRAVPSGEADDGTDAAQAPNEIGNPRKGGFEQSLEAYRRALGLAREVENEALADRALRGTADALIGLHRFREAMELCDQSGRSWVIDSSKRQWATYAAANVAPSERAAADYARAGELARAAETWTDAAQAARAFGISWDKLCLRTTAEAYRKAADLWRELGDTVHEAEAATEVAATLRFHAQLSSEAVEAYREAADLWHGLGDRSREADALMGYGDACYPRWPSNSVTGQDIDDHIREARAAYTQALVLYRKLFDWSGWVRAHRARMKVMRVARRRRRYLAGRAGDAPA